VAKKKSYVFVGCADPRNKTARIKGSFGEVALGETIELEDADIEMLRTKGFVFNEDGLEEPAPADDPEPVVDNDDPSGEEVN